MKIQNSFYIFEYSTWKNKGFDRKEKSYLERCFKIFCPNCKRSHMIEVSRLPITLKHLKKTEKNKTHWKILLSVFFSNVSKRSEVKRLQVLRRFFLLKAKNYFQLIFFFSSNRHFIFSRFFSRLFYFFEIMAKMYPPKFNDDIEFQLSLAFDEITIIRIAEGYTEADKPTREYPYWSARIKWIDSHWWIEIFSINWKNSIFSHKNKIL